jgi:hypothetical protein
MLTLVRDQPDLSDGDLKPGLSGRRSAQVQASGKRLDNILPARQNPRLRLKVRDISTGGLSALSDKPVLEGEHIAVQFPAPFGVPIWSAYGHVVHCEKGPKGYRLSVEFDPRPAA